MHMSEQYTVHSLSQIKRPHSHLCVDTSPGGHTWTWPADVAMRTCAPRALHHRYASMMCIGSVATVAAARAHMELCALSTDPRPSQPSWCRNVLMILLVALASSSQQYYCNERFQYRGRHHLHEAVTKVIAVPMLRETFLDQRLDSFVSHA